MKLCTLPGILPPVIIDDHALPDLVTDQVSTLKAWISEGFPE